MKLHFFFELDPILDNSLVTVGIENLEKADLDQEIAIKKDAKKAKGPPWIVKYLFVENWETGTVNQKVAQTYKNQ